ncbi:MAG: patatin-like phospholipase family protein [Bacteroidales bacterium]|nr:patatin-like phospholipase family protein [Bacteroidales bacterium]
MENNRIGKVVNKISRRISSSKFDTGLVLSGGAARGFAHAGAIKAIEEHDIKPDIVSGVSAGSIVGSFYCDGFAPEEIFEIFQKNKIFKFVKPIFKKHGLLNISGLKKVLEKNLRTKRIEDLEKPLIITATNIEEGLTTYFSEGNLVDLVLASSSIPVLFDPTIIDDITYVDGGVTDNFPIAPLKGKCKKLIGVHVNPVGPFDRKKGLLHIAASTFHLSIASGIEEKKKLLDHFIEPEKLSEFTYYDVKRGKEMYDIGYDKANDVLDGKK